MQNQNIVAAKSNINFNSANSLSNPKPSQQSNIMSSSSSSELPQNINEKFISDINLSPSSLAIIKSGKLTKQQTVPASTSNQKNSRFFQQDFQSNSNVNYTKQFPLQSRKIETQNPVTSSKIKSMILQQKQVEDPYDEYGKYNLKSKEQQNVKKSIEINQKDFKKQKNVFLGSRQPETEIPAYRQLNINQRYKSDPTSNIIQKQQITNTKLQICCIIKQNRDVLYLQFIPSKINILEALIFKIDSTYKTKIARSQDIQFHPVEITLTEQKDHWELQYKFSNHKINNIQQWLLDQKQIMYVGIIINDPKFVYQHRYSIYTQPQTHSKSNQKLIKIQSYDIDGIILKFNSIKQYPVKYILDLLGYKKSRGRCLKMEEKFYIKNQFLNYDFSKNKVNHLTARVIGQQYQFQLIIKQTLQLKQQQLNKLMLKQTPKKMSALAAYINSYQLKATPLQQASDFTTIINSFLKNYFTQLKSNQQDWKIQFVKSMMRQMQQRENYQGITHWMYPVDFKSQQADKNKKSITFPQFLRTTIKEPKRLDQRQNYTVFKIKSKTGKKIKLNQKNPNEETVIFKPFTNFKIIKELQNSIFLLEQNPIKQQAIQVNFILWLDNYSKQSQHIFNKLDCPISTYKYFFQSNQILDEWLQKHTDQISQPHIKIIIVTNMARTQNKVEIKDAGAKTVLLVRTKVPKAPIIMYVGNKQHSINWLKTYKIDIRTLQIINSDGQLIKSLRDHCSRNQLIKNDPSSIQSSPKVPQKIKSQSQKIKKQNWRSLFDFKLAE